MGSGDSGIAWNLEEEEDWKYLVTQIFPVFRQLIPSTPVVRGQLSSLQR